MVQKVINGEIQEPFEYVVIDVEEQHQGAVMEEMGNRRGDLKNMVMDGKGRVRLEFIAPARGLIGFRSSFLTMTSGSGILTNVFDHYGPVKGKWRWLVESTVCWCLWWPVRHLAMRCFSLQERGRLFIGPGVEVYEGMIIRLHSRDNDLVVNPTKAKQLTNIRASALMRISFSSPVPEALWIQALNS